MVEWIIPIASAVASIYGAYQGNRNREEAERLQEKRYQEMEEYRNREMANDHLQRADSQALLRQVEQNNKEYLDALENDAIRGGATAEAKVAAAQKAQKSYADVAAQLAAQGQQRKDAIDANWQTQQLERDRMRIANLTDPTAIQSMVTGLGSAASAFNSIYAHSAPQPTTSTPNTEDKKEK